MKIFLIKRYRTHPNFLLFNFFAHHLKSYFSLKSLISPFDFFTIHIKSKPLSWSNQTTNPIHQLIFCLRTRETGRETGRGLLFRPAIIAPIARWSSLSVVQPWLSESSLESLPWKAQAVSETPQNIERFYFYFWFFYQQILLPFCFYFWSVIISRVLVLFFKVSFACFGLYCSFFGFTKENLWSGEDLHTFNYNSIVSMVTTHIWLMISARIWVLV